ncbi:hypothetical protein D3C83_207000 [compost metagenome]
MDAIAECDMFVGLAQNIKCMRIIKNQWIMVGGMKHSLNNIPLTNNFPTDFNILKSPAFKRHMGWAVVA